MLSRASEDVPAALGFGDAAAVVGADDDAAGAAFSALWAVLVPAPATVMPALVCLGADPPLLFSAGRKSPSFSTTSPSEPDPTSMRISPWKTSRAAVWDFHSAAAVLSTLAMSTLGTPSLSSAMARPHERTQRAAARRTTASHRRSRTQWAGRRGQRQLVSES